MKLVSHPRIPENQNAKLRWQKCCLMCWLTAYFSHLFRWDVTFDLFINKLKIQNNIPRKYPKSFAGSKVAPSFFRSWTNLYTAWADPFNRTHFFATSVSFKITYANLYIFSRLGREKKSQWIWSIEPLKNVKAIYKYTYSNQ